MGHSENYTRIAQPYDAGAVGTISRITPTKMDVSGGFLL